MVQEKFQSRGRTPYLICGHPKCGSLVFRKTGDEVGQLEGLIDGFAAFEAIIALLESDFTFIPLRYLVKESI